jgi:hypothetical protein
VADLKARLGEEQRRARDSAARASAELLAVRQELLVGTRGGVPGTEGCGGM